MVGEMGLSTDGLNNTDFHSPRRTGLWLLLDARSANTADTNTEPQTWRYSLG